MPKFGFRHVAISVADIDAQRRFYGLAFGLTVEQARLDLAEGTMQMVILESADGLELELVQRKGSVPHRSDGLEQATARQGYFAMALEVTDLDHTFEHVIASGATAISRPAAASRPSVRFAYVQDPEGNMIELLESSPDSLSETQ